MVMQYVTGSYRGVIPLTFKSVLPLSNTLKHAQPICAPETSRVNWFKVPDIIYLKLDMEKR